MSTIPVSAELLAKLVEDGRVSEVTDAEWTELRALLVSPQDSAGAVAYVLKEEEMGIGYDRRVGPVVWIGGYPPGGSYLYTTPQPAGPAVEVAGEREEFEAWARDEGFSLDRDATGRLISDEPRSAWLGWEYRAAWQRTQSAGVPDARRPLA